MYKGQRVKKTTRNHKRAGRNIALLLSLVLLLGAATVGTMAYFTASASSTSSGITIGNVECEVSQSGDTYTIKNVGNIPAYIRVAVVANYVDDQGVVQWEAPALGIDYTVMPMDDCCKYNEADGFYYSKDTVAAKDSVSLTVIPDVVGVQVQDVVGVQVQVFAEAIQGQAYAAKDAWGYQY